MRRHSPVRLFHRLSFSAFHENPLWRASESQLAIGVLVFNIYTQKHAGILQLREMGLGLGRLNGHFIGGPSFLCYDPCSARVLVNIPFSFILLFLFLLMASDD